MSTIAYTFTARFAGLELEIETWTEDIGRTVIRHTPTRGDGAQLSDRGQEPRTYNLSIRLTGTAVEVAEKRAALIELRASKETRVFQHPLDGIVRCKLEALSGSIAAGNVSYTVVLIEDLAFTRRFAETGQASMASLQDVEITADELILSLTALFLEDGPGLDLALEDGPDIETAVGKAATWTERSQSDITADVEAMRDDVLDLRRELDASTDVELFLASVKLEAFRGSYERYAQAVNGIRGAVFELNVAQPLPLIVTLTSLYGAVVAETLLDEVARINSVLDVTRVPVGAMLSLPSAVL